jgi:hypothetical protein
MKEYFLCVKQNKYIYKFYHFINMYCNFMEYTNNIKYQIRIYNIILLTIRLSNVLHFNLNIF